MIPPLWNPRTPELQLYYRLVKEGFPGHFARGRNLALEWVEQVYRKNRSLYSDVLPVLIAANLALAEYGHEFQLGALRLAGLVPEEDRTLWIRRVSEVIRVRRDPRALGVLGESEIPAATSGLRPPACPFSSLREVVETRFEGQVLGEFARPTLEDPYTPAVALAHTVRGWGVVKEVRDESGGPLAITDREHTILAHLNATECPGVPSLYEIHAGPGGRVWLSRECARGAVLDRTEWQGCAPATAVSTVAQIARTLAEIHERGVWVADLHPGNVTTEGWIYDHSHSRRVDSGETVVAFPAVPAYTAPEVTLTRRAGTSADLYALGVLFYEMLTREHPYAQGLTVPPDTDRAGQLLAYAAPATWMPYTPREAACDPRWTALLRAMLQVDPDRRPTARQVADHLTRVAEQPSMVNPPPLRRLSSPSGQPRVLVPMRAGVPHRGHVELLARLLDAGCVLTVALPRAFTWTEADPQPKWTVARQLRASLRALGYRDAEVNFVYVPFVRMDTMLLHYLMMPGWEETVAVVSGNPDIARMLEPIRENRPVVHAEAICGDGALEQSNGTRLRRAYVEGDLEQIKKMAPVAVREGWPRLSETFPKPEEILEHIPAELVEVELQWDGVLHRALLLPLEGPEEAVVRMLRNRTGNPQWELGDRALPQATLGDGTHTYRLHYRGQRLTPRGRLQMAFEVL